MLPESLAIPITTALSSQLPRLESCANEEIRKQLGGFFWTGLCHSGYSETFVYVLKQASSNTNRTRNGNLWPTSCCGFTESCSRHSLWNSACGASIKRRQ